MKKLINLLFIVLLTTVTWSCSNSIEERLSDNISTEQIQPYQQYIQENVVEDITMKYHIAELEGKTYIFNMYEQFEVDDIIYYKDELLNKNKRKVVICSESTYNTISNSELLFEKTENCIHLYKQTDDTYYRKFVYYINPPDNNTLVKYNHRL